MQLYCTSGAVHFPMCVRHTFAHASVLSHTSVAIKHIEPARLVVVVVVVLVAVFPSLCFYQAVFRPAILPGSFAWLHKIIAKYALRHIIIH